MGILVYSLLWVYAGFMSSAVLTAAHVMWKERRTPVRAA